MQTVFALGGVGVALVLLVFVVMLLWICMPFAIFGTKPLLRELLAEQQRTNRLLEEAARRETAEKANPAHALLVSEEYRGQPYGVHVR